MIAARSRSLFVERLFGSLHVHVILGECDRVGKRVRALGRPVVQNEGRIEIGSYVTLRSLGSPVRLLATASGTLVVGDGTVVDMGASLVATSYVQIGAGVIIGPDAVVRDVDDAGVSEPVVIEEGARIGARARIEKGVTIGRGAIVKSGSVVRADVPPGAIVSGVVAHESAPVSRVVRRGRLGAAPAEDARSVQRGQTLLTAGFTVDPLREQLAARDFDGLAVAAEVAP